MPKKTPLNAIHKQLGARMVDFAGWEMPVQYAGVGEEHRAVRQKAGIFDVSHMGEIEIAGSGAGELVQRVTCNDALKLKDGDCQYSAFLTEAGTFIDDVIVNRLAEDRILICVNASNTDKDFEWVRGHAKGNVRVENASNLYFQIALQGPEAGRILQKAAGRELPPKPFTFFRTDIRGAPVLIARTGYTGEDGCEIYGDPSGAEGVWNLLMEHGAVPCGLGVRDTLRLEAALSLYGHEIDETTHPYEARLGWIVKLQKGDFVGREALLRIRQNAEARKLVGLEMTEPGIARQGYKIYHEDTEVGFITSGTKSPSLDSAIALGYVRNELSDVGTKIQVDIHHKKREAVVVSLPFYKRASWQK